MNDDSITTKNAELNQARRAMAAAVGSCEIGRPGFQVVPQGMSTARGKQVSVSFYSRNLNRMMLADLRSSIEKSGLELMTLMPRINQEHL